MRKRDDLRERRVWGPSPRYSFVRTYRRPSHHRGIISIMGPCSIEGREQMEKVCRKLKPLKPTYIRGGPWSYGTYPPDPELQGIRLESLYEAWDAVGNHGLGLIIECLDMRNLYDIRTHSDAVQIGARQMQNYPMLSELGSYNVDLTLKRHPGATVDELLGACEYILRAGKARPILIERGSSSFHNHVRWSLDVSLIAHVKSVCDVPILVDASHGGGRRDLVEPLILAGMAAGADGFLLECHPDPERSISDAEQAVNLDDAVRIFKKAKKVYDLVRRKK